MPPRGRPRGSRNRRRAVGNQPASMRLNRRRTGRYYKKGILNITRKTNVCYLANTVAVGIPIAIAGAGMSTEWLNLGTAIATNGQNYDIPFTMTFRLSDVVNYAEIANLCDDFKINNVKITIYYNSNVAGVDTPASMPSLFYISDDDSAEVQTVSQLRQRMGLRLKQFTANKPRCLMKLVPKVAPIIYDGVTTVGYAIPMRPTWLNTSYPSVPHYSVKGYLSNVYCPSITDKTQSTLFTFDITYDITGKDFD